MQPLRFLLIACLSFVSACNYSVPHLPASGSSGPTAWIDQPLEGDMVTLGASVPIRWHATDLNGISQVEIQINGATLEIVTDLESEARLVTQETSWDPAEAGEYRIEVIATNREGLASAPADKRVTVVVQPEFTATPTPTPTATPTSTPTVTATLRPPVTVPPVLPIATTLVPIDDVPPPEPQILSPEAEVLGCLEDIVLQWNSVTDSSGIDIYEVVLKVNTGGANFSTVGTWQVESFTALNVNGQTDCGSTYGWTVRARDNAGNWGPSDSALFGIDLP